ncbi:Hypp2565 [Branchiostoma lanceolatum]|uniref:Hypp2565 protein n=1 Tax=Branchiostoma lanceolatum TaxID=7740 RepID=A0A8J9ZV52_BRALA|nr:Hypp2565 [Branchiostoma lanceolatum]
MEGNQSSRRSAADGGRAADSVVTLFKDDPQLMAVFNQKFRHLRERDADVLYQDAILDAHAATVMEALHEAITHVDDSAYVMKVLHDVGKMHQRYNVDPSVFLKVEKPFLAAVSDVLGDRYTKNMEEIYTITIKFILETLSEGATLELTDDEEKNLSRLWRPPGRVHKFVRPEKVAAIVDAEAEENGVH